MPADWRVYQITGEDFDRHNWRPNFSKFFLNDYVQFRDRNESYIYVSCPYCVSWKVDDYIEIDNNETCSKTSGYLFDCEYQIRKGSMSLFRYQADNSSLQGRNSYLQSEISGLQARNYGLESEKVSLREQIEWGKGQLAIRDNQITTYTNQLMVRNSAFEALNQKFSALQIENNNKDNELAKRESKIKELKEMLGKSQEEILKHKIRIKEEKLEEFVQQLGVNWEQVHNLRNFYKQLIRAQENYNQDNIDTAENNIENTKRTIMSGGINVSNTQKICRKSEKLAKLKVEQDKLYQEQFQTNIGVPPRPNQ